MHRSRSQEEEERRREFTAELIQEFNDCGQITSSTPAGDGWYDVILTVDLGGATYHAEICIESLDGPFEIYEENIIEG